MKHFILMGEKGKRVLFREENLEAAEEIEGKGVRLHMSCGAEIDAWGLTMNQLVEECAKEFEKGKK